MTPTDIKAAVERVKLIARYVDGASCDFITDFLPGDGDAVRALLSRISTLEAETKAKDAALSVARGALEEIKDLPYRAEPGRYSCDIARRALLSLGEAPQADRVKELEFAFAILAACAAGMTARWARAGHAASERSNQLQHAFNKNRELEANLSIAMGALERIAATARDGRRTASLPVIDRWATEALSHIKEGSSHG